MFPEVLFFHSAVRWLVLTSLLFAIVRSYRGWFLDRPFSKFDDTVRHWTATIAHVQLVLGLWLYFASPIVDYFLKNFKTAIHEDELRFFGMEHASMMLTAILLVTIGSALSKRQKVDKNKFRTMAIWFTIGLVIILVSIPWPFSPLSSRPYARLF